MLARMCRFPTHVGVWDHRPRTPALSKMLDMRISRSIASSRQSRVAFRGGGLGHVDANSVCVDAGELFPVLPELHRATV